MRLDYSIPFVKQVWDYRQRLIPIEECVTTLEAACERHGISFVVPELVFDEKGNSIDPRMPHVRIISDDEQEWERWVDTNFFAFLTETHLVLRSSDYSPLYSTIIGPIVIYTSMRAEGSMYAKWANSISWLGKQDWDYMPFYIGYIADDYEEWSKTAFYVLERMNYTQNRGRN